MAPSTVQPPHLPQAQEAQRQALFQAAVRVTRHHAQKFEQRLVAAQAGTPAPAPRQPTPVA